MRSLLLLVCLACLTAAAVPAGGQSLARDVPGPHAGGEAPLAEAPGQRLSTTLVAHEAHVSGSFEVAVLDGDLAASPSNYTRADRLATFCRQLGGPIADLRDRRAATVDAHEAGDLDDPVLRSRLVTIEARATTLRSMADSAGERADALPRRAVRDAGLDPGCFDRHAAASARVAANASDHLAEDDDEDPEESVLFDGAEDADAPWGDDDFDRDEWEGEWGDDGREDDPSHWDGRDDDGEAGDRGDGEHDIGEAPSANDSDDDRRHHHGWLGSHDDWHEGDAGWNDSGGYSSAWSDPDGDGNWSDSRFDPNATGPGDVPAGWNGTHGGAGGPTDGDSADGDPWAGAPGGDGFGDGPEPDAGGNWSNDPWAPDANHSEDWDHDGPWGANGSEDSFADGEWTGDGENRSAGWGDGATGDGDATAWNVREGDGSSNDSADGGTGEQGDEPASDDPWGGDGGSWDDGDDGARDDGWSDGGYWGGDAPDDGR